MIISLQRGYVFVANTKAASTTIERLLFPHVDICLFTQPKLKHMHLEKIYNKFTPVLRASTHDLQEFVSFCVMRDPTEWTVSWFNYLSRPRSQQRGNRYAGDVEFEEFCQVLAKPRDTPGLPPWASIGEQVRRFSVNGELAINAIVDHARISDGFAQLAELIGHDLSEDLQSRRENVSKNVRLRIDDVTDAQRALLRQRFRSDYELYDTVSESPHGVHWANPT